MVGFRYYNNNPYGEKENDCVTRAIANVSGLDYNEVKDKLFYVGKLFDYEPKCVYCYSFIIRQS